MENRLVVDKEFMRLIPPLLEEEYKQLEQNILAEGKLLNPIILWDGIIVDGHNRFYICMKHGIEFELKDMHFDSREEAKLWILENQLGRRNLTDAARIELALKKEELLKRLSKERQKLGGKRKGKLLSKSSTETEKPVHVQKAIAKKAGISEGTLFMYKQIMEQGNPTLKEAVQNGKLKIGSAYKMLPAQIAKQLKQADKMYAYIKRYLPTITDEEEKADINNQLLYLREQLQALLERRKSYEAEN